MFTIKRLKRLSDHNTTTTTPPRKAPLPSTDKCPNDVAEDKNGNCNPLTQLSDESSNDDSIPKFPTGDIF